MNVLPKCVCSRVSLSLLWTNMYIIFGLITSENEAQRVNLNRNSVQSCYPMVGTMPLILSWAYSSKAPFCSSWPNGSNEGSAPFWFRPFCESMMRKMLYSNGRKLFCPGEGSCPACYIFVWPCNGSWNRIPWSANNLIWKLFLLYLNKAICVVLNIVEISCCSFSGYPIPIVL